MKKTLIHNLFYVILGLALAFTLSVSFAADFTGPTASAPGGNVPTPLHTGPDQVKDGGLSVNGFIANQNAQFKQQVFLNGTVLGGSPTNNEASSAINIGDQNTPTNISVSGGLSAHSYLQSSSVANSSNLSLCATSNGTIVNCSAATVLDDPTIAPIGPVGGFTFNNETQQQFQVGPSVTPGDTYSMGVYEHEVTVTAAPGDDSSAIVEKLISAINATTAGEWNDQGAAPATGTPGFPPIAQSNPNNPAFIIVILNKTNDFGASASPASQ
jgi:hypothetical protein